MEMVSIIIAIIGLLLGMYNFTENKKKNSADIMPFFDVDINNILIYSSKRANYIKFSIPLFNLGNKIATDIKIGNLEGNEILSSNFAMEKTALYLIIQDNFYNIIGKERNMFITLEFKDLMEKKYIQDIELGIIISPSYNNQLFKIFNINYLDGNFNFYQSFIPQDEVINAYITNKGVGKPKRI